MRIGVMGGSFNPPHEGHLIVARTARKRLRLDQLWWLLTPGNPLKDTAELAPLEDRAAAIRSLSPSPRMKLTAFERELGTPYTSATLKFLTRRYRLVNFVWVMGADNLAHFHRWQHWQAIAETVPIAVVDRPQWRFPALASPAARSLKMHRIPEHRAAGVPDCATPAWTFLTTRLSPLSSTDLRSTRASE